MPEVSDDPSAATLTEWLVAESASFTSAQSLATVETEKLVVSVEVAEPGVLLKRLVGPGDGIETGTPLAVLGDPGEFVTDIDELLVRLGVAEATRTVPPASAPAETALAPRHLGHLAADDTREPEQARALPSSLVYAWAPQAPHDDRADVVSSSLLPPSPWSDPEVSRVATLAELAVSAGSEPDDTSADPETHATTTVHSLGELTQVHLRSTVRAEAILAVRDEVDGLSVTDLVVKAVGAALLRVPQLGGGRTTADVAVAVLTDHGIATPVVRDVGSLTATAVAATLRAGSDRPGTDVLADDVGTAAVTVADVGRYGVEEFAVDVTPSRRAVLGIGAVREEPVVEAGVLVPGSVMSVTLSVDESLADVAVATRWFAVLTELLEHPLRFLA